MLTRRVNRRYKLVPELDQVSVQIDTIEIVRALKDDNDLEIRSIAAEWLMDTSADSWPRNGIGSQLMIELPGRSGE